MDSETNSRFKCVIGEEELRNAFYRFIQQRGAGTLLPENASLPAVLSFVNSEQEINEVLKGIFGHATSVDFNSKAMREVVRRKIELDGDPQPVRLDVMCELEISYVTIPEPQKDEIVLSVMLHTGINTNNLREYLLKNKLCTAAEFRRYEKNWRSLDIGIDMEERERKLLEKVLRLEILEGYEADIKYICYNFSESEIGPLMWRCCAFSTPVRIPLDYSEYPFDRHYLSFYLVSPDSFDVTDQYLYGDDREEEGISSLLTAGLVGPRSLNFSGRSKGLLDVAMLSRLDVWPESMIRFDLGFTRAPTSFFWHTYIPTAVIAVFSLIATGFALQNRANDAHLVSVLTTLLPTVLIAIAALQLVAAQNVPPNAGHTRQDDLFIIYYISLLFFFLCLHPLGDIITKILFLLGAILIVTGLTYFAILIAKNSRKSKMGIN